MIKLHTVKNWGVTVDPQQNGENISGGWHSELGGRTPNPPVILTLLSRYYTLSPTRLRPGIQPLLNV